MHQNISQFFFKNTYGKSTPIFQLRSITDNLPFFCNYNAPGKYKYHTLFGSNSATNSPPFVTHHSFKLFQQSLFIDITLESRGTVWSEGFLHKVAPPELKISPNVYFIMYNSVMLSKILPIIVPFSPYLSMSIIIKIINFIK